MSQCIGQMSIFDFIEVPEELPTLSEIIDLITVKYGINFVEETWNFLGNKSVYIHSFKKSVLEIYESKYTNGQRFISVNWHDNLGGFGSPCDCIERIYSCVESAINKGAYGR